MHALTDWIDQVLCYIKIIICSIIDQADCNSGPFRAFQWTFLYILVDLLVDLSLSGGGGGGGGVLQNPENPSHQ